MKPNKILTILLFTGSLFLISNSALAQKPTLRKVLVLQTVTLSNTYDSPKRGLYNWKVFLVGNAAILRSVSYVEYTLHPSIVRPFRRVTVKDGGANFSTQGSSSGEFDIKAKVVFSNASQSPTYLTYHLNLHSKP